MLLKSFCGGIMEKGMRTCIDIILPLWIDGPEMTDLHEVIKSRCRWMKECMGRGGEQIPWCFPPIVCLSVQKGQSGWFWIRINKGSTIFLHHSLDFFCSLGQLETDCVMAILRVVFEYIIEIGCSSMCIHGAEQNVL